MTCLVNVHSSATILVVDDAPDNLRLVFQHLRNVGHNILIAQSGERAIDTALAMQPNLILLDIKMSGLDGFATCRRLKNNDLTKEIPIIFMSAMAETKNKVMGLTLGAVDYITKPIEEQELLARIKTHLALYTLNQRLVKDAARQRLLFKISDRIRQSLDLHSITETATREIRSFLDCDFVALTQLKKQNIKIKALSSAENLNFEPNIIYENICPNAEELQFYLEGNIRNIDQESKIVADNPNLKLEARLIAPILIKCEDFVDMGASTSSLNRTNDLILWGWLIADRYRLARCWQTEEIDLIKELTTQLAIAIKQGLLHKRISQLAICDSLTKVYNRRYFDRQLNLEWGRLRRSSSPISLIMCDVDHFKIYNDTYGHQQGDKCLRQIAQAISQTVKRSGDVVARYGGEEFAVILPGVDRSGAMQVARSIKSAVKRLKIPHLNSVTDSVVTTSIGIATTTPGSENQPDLLIEAADLALYQAKKSGRDRINTYVQAISKTQVESNSSYKLSQINPLVS